MEKILLLLLSLLAASSVKASALEWVRIADDTRGFVSVPSGTTFVPWGFNYDHDADGRLIEDYWLDEWPKVEAAFRQMKRLGANVVRIHLQYGQLMSSPTEPRQTTLDQLAKLLKFAEQTELYLDLTGLGCYHKTDVPDWYDRLSETERWQSQARFWKAVAQTCAQSPAVFCYDLMNEPVVAGGDGKRDDWLGPAFAGKHFVQFISLERAHRERHEIARQWIKTLVTAIREHDKRHLVTVGLVPWSLDRPGLTSGFIPERIAPELDFLAVHLYPEQGKLAESVETLQQFAAVGKPVVIEEIFPLRCNLQDLEHFINQSRTHSSGWIGFYWGQTPAELREAQTIPAAITLGWLDLFQQLAPQMKGP